MIKFFRKIRQNLLSQGRTGKYLKYAIGEIVLVVIGILIALQINNWNQERIESEELEGLLQSISSSVQSDIKNLNLLTTARRNMGEKSRRIYDEHINSNKTTINLREVTYVGLAFQDINNLISFSAKLSTFESLKNSTYYRKIQNTDLASLLFAYYINAQKIKQAEDRHNENIERRNQEWYTKFSDNLNDQEVFLRPWNLYESFESFESRYLEILRDVSSRNVIGPGKFEPYFIKQYEEQILMGKAIVKMIENSETAFDEQIKLDFSGILYSFANADVLSILINGKIPTGFALKSVASGIIDDYYNYEEDYLEIKYAENKFVWASPYFEVNALGGRVNEMDFSGYTKLLLEMKGSKGGEIFDVVMKDKNDPPDGSEARVKLELTDQWKIYEIDLSEFTTADLELINVPFGLVFEGPKGRVIRLKTVQFKKG